MAYNQTSEYPSKVLRIDALSDTPKVVTAAGTPIRIAGILLSEQAGAAEKILFRNNANSIDYGSLRVGANSTAFFPVRWLVDDLEVVSASAGNTDVTFFIDNSGVISAVEV